MQLFKEFDVKGNKFLGQDELQKMLIKLSVPVEERFTAELLKKMDYNGNGNVDFDEFKNFLFN
jgi:Ca2+-binding EF-hand superfamily protein